MEAKEKFREQDKKYIKLQKEIMNEISEREENYREANDVEEVPESVRMKWINELSSEKDLAGEYMELLERKKEMDMERRG